MDQRFIEEEKKLVTFKIQLKVKEASLIEILFWVLIKVYFKKSFIYTCTYIA
jgi:hypothetical protein